MLWCLSVLSLSAFLVVYFFGSEVLANKVLASISNADGVEVSVAGSEFDPVSVSFIFKGVRVVYGDVLIQSKEMMVRLSVSSLFRAYFNNEVMAFSHLVFLDSTLKVNTDSLLQAGLPVFLRSMSDAVKFARGLIVLEGRDLPLGKTIAFNDLEILDKGEHIQIEADSNIGSFNWRFFGRLLSTDNVLSGQLELEDIPVSSLMQADDIEGKVDASLSVTWSAEEGVSAEGALMGKAGSYRSDGLTVSWAEWTVTDFNIKPSGKPKGRLEIRSADINMASMDHWQEVLLNVYSALPVTLSDLTIQDGTVNVPGVHSPWKLTNLLATIMIGQDAFVEYKGNGKVKGRGLISLSGYGRLFDNQVTENYRLSFSDIPLSAISPQYLNLIDLNTDQGRLNLTYKSDAAKGLIEIAGLNDNSGRNKRTKSRLEVLLTSRKNRMSLPLYFNESASQLPFFDSLYSQLRQKLEGITNDPFQYLSELLPAGEKLSPIIEYQPGKVSIKPGSLSNFKNAAQVLHERPLLKLDISVAVDRERDWPVLAKAELEKNLAELYAVLKPLSVENKVPMPQRVREQLLEQMYLAVQKRKLPEIDGLSHARRLENAELWLINNWPENSELLVDLQRRRMEEVRDIFQQFGVDEKRFTIRKSGSNGNQTESQMIPVN